MRSRLHRASLIAFALTLCACGPTDDEIAVSLICGLPVIFACAAGLNLALLAAWRHRTKLVGAGPWPLALAGLAVVTLAAIFIGINGPVDPELIGLVVTIAGPGLVTLALVAARMSLDLPAVVSVVVIPLLLCVAAAVPLMMVWQLEGPPARELAQQIFPVMMWTSAASPAVFLGVFIEGIVKLRRARLELEAQP